MAKVTVAITGLRELNQNLRKFSVEVRKDVMKKAARNAAQDVRDTARSIVTAKGLIITGAMREAIGARRIKKSCTDDEEFWAAGVFKIPGGTYAKTRANVRAGRVGKVYTVDPPEFYWKFVEFGTVNMEAKPFLVPAFETRKAGLAHAMKVDLAKGIASATRKLSKPRKKAA